MIEYLILNHRNSTRRQSIPAPAHSPALVSLVRPFIILRLLCILVVVLEGVGGHGDVASGVGAFLALVLLVAEVLAAHSGQHLVGLGPVPVLAELVHICVAAWMGWDDGMGYTRKIIKKLTK